MSILTLKVHCLNFYIFVKTLKVLVFVCRTILTILFQFEF